MQPFYLLYAENASTYETDYRFLTIVSPYLEQEAGSHLDRLRFDTV
jgi:hypothetical protein